MKFRLDASPSRVREIFDYNPDTGVLIYRINRRPMRIGQIAGFDNFFGYRQICIDYKKYYLHRIVWLWWYGKWPEEEIDHINGIRSDNRISNLREASRSQNHCNRVVTSRSEIGLKGVSRTKDKKRFRTRFKMGGMEINLGTFATAEEAHQMYTIYTKAFHEEFALANRGSSYEQDQDR